MTLHFWEPFGEISCLFSVLCFLLGGLLSLETVGEMIFVKIVGEVFPVNPLVHKVFLVNPLVHIG
ncbi:hypothetical protein BOW52_09835 [Solemya elarraichensis gill symbiont]|uniref:Uncharacterized protein n=1 Tax=Solemya elarraichensis gill symbiont TaxID=1918949 RepID=A0A1T2KYK4_9GAMM|nr:hypothetical protein BOW52_09835 [Solemya elarraichensis gill symbiont]